MLIKTYRLVWNSKNILLWNPIIEFKNDITQVGNGLNSFESDSKEEVASFIIENNLIWQDIF